MSQQRVSFRLKKGMNLPGEYVRAASEATGVPKEELRPDLYPPTHPQRRGTTTMVDRSQHHLFSDEVVQ